MKLIERAEEVANFSRAMLTYPFILFGLPRVTERVAKLVGLDEKWQMIVTIGAHRRAERWQMEFGYGRLGANWHEAEAQKLITSLKEKHNTYAD